MPSQDPDTRLGELSLENARLREQIETFAGERKRLDADLERALAATQAAKEELQGFVYAASHDLKEPLRAISSYTQLLQRHRANDEEVAEYSRYIIDGVMSATGLLEQLLRFSRAGSSPRRAMVNLAVPLQAALFKLQQSIKELSAEIVSGQLPEFSVDEAQFTQLLENLIDNALKYRSGERPRIEIAAEETDEGLLLSVRDNGIGIAPEFHRQIFAPFKRLHGREIPGAGLGLAVGRKIVEAHEGTLSVESAVPGGSTFKVSLPY